MSRHKESSHFRATSAPPTVMLRPDDIQPLVERQDDFRAVRAASVRKRTSRSDLAGLSGYVRTNNHEDVISVTFPNGARVGGGSAGAPMSVAFLSQTQIEPADVVAQALRYWTGMYCRLIANDVLRALRVRGMLREGV